MLKHLTPAQISIHIPFIRFCSFVSLLLFRWLFFFFRVIEMKNKLMAKRNRVIGFVSEPRSNYAYMKIKIIKMKIISVCFRFFILFQLFCECISNKWMKKYINFMASSVLDNFITFHFIDNRQCIKKLLLKNFFYISKWIFQVWFSYFFYFQLMH